MNMSSYDIFQEPEGQYGLKEVIQNKMEKQGLYWLVQGYWQSAVRVVGMLKSKNVLKKTNRFLFIIWKKHLDALWHIAQVSFFDQRFYISSAFCFGIRLVCKFYWLLHIYYQLVSNEYWKKCDEKQITQPWRFLSNSHSGISLRALGFHGAQGPFHKEFHYHKIMANSTFYPS